MTAVRFSRRAFGDLKSRPPELLLSSRALNLRETGGASPGLTLVTWPINGATLEQDTEPTGGADPGGRLPAGGRRGGPCSGRGRPPPPSPKAAIPSPQVYNLAYLGLPEELVRRAAAWRCEDVDELGSPRLLGRPNIELAGLQDAKVPSLALAWCQRAPMRLRAAGLPRTLPIPCLNHGPG